MKTESELCQQKIYDIAKSVRDKLIRKYGDCLCGKCIETSEKIAEKLIQAGIKCKIVEGWCVYDEFMGCSDRPYDEHTQVVATVYNKKLYVDVTAKSKMCSKINPAAHFLFFPVFFALFKPLGLIGNI